MQSALTPAHASRARMAAAVISRQARGISSGSMARRSSPIYGFLCRTPWYHASPARRRPSRPAQTDSVCAEFGLACRYRSRRKMRQPFFASKPRIAPAASRNSADSRAGMKFSTSSAFAGTRPIFLYGGST